ncbi:hypothetical protein WMF30_35510 [Sorangium sp. So ce134]
MRLSQFDEVHRFRAAAVLAAALHATACHQVPECLHCTDPDPAPDPLSETMDGCGVFANASAQPGGNGTKGSPYARLQEAIDGANGKRVCACAGQPFHEAVTLRAGIEVVGGFTCDVWTRPPGARSAVQGPPGQVALTLTAEAGGAKVEAFEFSAASAEGRLEGSAIAVAVADIAAELREVHVSAGDAKRGSDGAPETESAVPGADAPRGNEDGAPTAPCLSSDPQGGQPGLTMCGDVDTRGGAGGPGGTLREQDRGNRSGERGSNGVATPDPMTTTTGNGGSFNERWVIVSAADGSPGIPGTPGAGGGRGPLTLSGIQGGDGADGDPGKPGQGGGGGVGGLKMRQCPSPNDALLAGPSGGGGGAGGCGGKGGAGGRAGGSSIGIVSLGTKLVLVEVTAAVGKAGDGGSGAAGQSGGRGGNGAPGSVIEGYDLWSSNGMGGNGGSGGAGGPGGGGRGGYALGIAYASCPAASGAATGLAVRSLGNPGAGGKGGEDWRPDVLSSPGEPGVRAECWCSDTNASCGE